jgi:subtilisin family serine protease
VIVMLRGTANSTAGQPGVLGELLRDRATNVTAFHMIDAVAATVTPATACALERNPEVGAVVPDRQLRLVGGSAPIYSRRVVALPSVPAGVVTEPESLGLTGATTVQASGDNGQGVLVADIDSGIDTTQPNLQGVLAKNSAGQTLYRDFTGTGLDDSMGHGTGTAGMIVSQGTTAYEVSTTPYYGPIAGDPTVDTSFRVLGMAPAAKLIAAKVFDPSLPGNGGYESWIISAIQWVVDNHAQVINESWGWQDIPTDMPDPVVLADDAAAKDGAIVCVAAGNSGPGFGTVADPAASADVVSVGASTMFRDMAEDGFLAPYGKYESDSLASFSSRGPTSDGRMAPDLLSPGENGWSVFAVTGPAAGAGVGLFSGTSQASPIVAGAFALALSAYQQHFGKAPPSGYLPQLLMNTADDLGFDAEDQSAGRVDVARAVAAIDGTGPDVAIGPTQLELTGSAGEIAKGSLTLTNHRKSAVTVKTSLFTQQQTAATNFSGTTPASESGASSRFVFRVRAGANLLSATAIWHTANNQPLLVDVFDPHGRLVNYASGGGIAAVEVAHPLVGEWTIYVGNQNAEAEPFQLEVTASTDVAIGTVSPATAVIQPGSAKTIAVSLALPATAGRTVDTLKIAEPGGTETVPVISTVDVPSGGQFSGTFTSPSSSGLDAEVYTYEVVVPKGAASVTASASWPSAGNAIELLLVDPQQKVVAHSKYSLTNPSTTVTVPSPAAGTWQVIVTCPVFDGSEFTIPFTGAVKF